jgi:ATP-dependent RNA helicase RhlE
MSFEELGLSEALLRAVRNEGYTDPTPIQAQAIPHVIAGRDLLGCAQTGTGKTAAFALPVLHRLTQRGNPPRGSGRKIRVLVLSPTRELAAQIADSFGLYGRHTPLRRTCVFGGVGQGPQVRALKHGVDILIATPGRLNDLMEQGFIDLSSVEIFVLDEADRMLDIGFLPDIRRVIAKLPKQRQTLFFSATMAGEVARLASDILVDPAEVRIAPVQATTELIEQSVYHVNKADKGALLAGLIKEAASQRAIVFTRTKHGADKVTRFLNQQGIAADAIHGNKSQNARQRALLDFKRSRTKVLVATDLAARGIDVDNVSHVFNFDLPQEAETYVHRIGRTGRAGATGLAVSFCDIEERGMLQAVERLTRKPLNVVTQAPAGLEGVDLTPPSPRHQGGNGGNGAGNGRGGFKPGKKRFFGGGAKRFGSRGGNTGSGSSSGGGNSQGGGSHQRSGGPATGHGFGHQPRKKKRPAAVGGR